MAKVSRKVEASEGNRSRLRVENEIKERNDLRARKTPLLKILNVLG